MWEGAFSCPFCYDAAQQVVCDHCYKDVLLSMHPITEGLQTSWFSAHGEIYDKVMSALEFGQMWPSILIAHMLYEFRARCDRLKFAVYDQNDTMRQDADMLVDCLTYLWGDEAQQKVYLCWEKPDARPRKLNWVIFR